MKERHTGWSRRDWNSKPRVEGASQSSHDEWKSSQPQSKWKEISLEMDALGSALTGKTYTWNESCKESAIRETELYKVMEIATEDEKQEDTGRNIKKTLKHLRKEEEQADEVRTLLDDMQQNVDEAEATVTETRRRLCREINECVKNFGDHTFSWIKCGKRCKATTPRR